MLKWVPVLIAWCLCIAGCAGDGPPVAESPDYLIMAYGSGVATPGLPNTNLLDDSANQSILRACLDGSSFTELNRLPFDSLEQRIDRLCDGRVLIREDSILRPGLPVFADDRQRRLDSIADACADQLVEPVVDLLDDMRSSDATVGDDLFHVLWSLVIDQSWYPLWDRIRPAESGPPQVCWIVDPPHEYLAGTNSWQLPGGSIVFATWSPQCDEHLERLPRLRLQLLHAAWDMPGDDSTGQATLRRYGLLSADGTYQGRTFADSSVFESEASEWIERYADDVARVLDLEKAALALETPEGQTFVILLHQVAYALFQRLDTSGALAFPPILKSGVPLEEIADLVSVRLVRRPVPKDVALAVFMESGWHGTEEVVPLFHQALSSDPQDLLMRLLFGMALYDLERYEDAINELDALQRLAAADPEAKSLYDWSRVWLGHVYDAMGDRTRAREWYQAVADDGAESSEMSFAQYGIRKTSAVSWAQERLKTPFAWHRP
jgi:tetratricopeptide (TPR) repeat protein